METDRKSVFLLLDKGVGSMTREDALKMLHGMKADNLNLEDAYIKDRYEALVMAIEALEHESCEDAISREAVKELFQEACEMKMYDFLGIDDLLPVTPQPKTGHWIQISPHSIYECSECGQTVMTSDICAYEFCHGCGLRMVELQESEEV